MSAARQLLKALERLHNAGIVHNGELALVCCYSVHANYSRSGQDERYVGCHPPRQSLESIVKQERPEVSSVERDHLVKFMSKGFCYSPDDRLSATQLLQDPSFQAVMEIYCG
jgi:hypothetical protein